MAAGEQDTIEDPAGAQKQLEMDFSREPDEQMMPDYDEGANTERNGNEGLNSASIEKMQFPDDATDDH